MVLLVALASLFSQIPQSTPVQSDTAVTRVVQINRIIILGNKITRDRIILRELSLKSGDTISVNRLDNVLLKDRNKIYNLRLFNTVVVRTMAFDELRVDLLVEVTERWYTFATPIFELSDRNFNEWWQNYDHDFKRVNYGLRLTQWNFRGRNETVRLTAQFGFTRKFILSYRIPNIGKTQKHGLVFDISYDEPKNAAYFTNDHKLKFLQEDKTVRKAMGGSVSYTYRRSFYETHSFSLDYESASVLDTVLTLNPNYYRFGKTSQRYSALSYGFNSEHRDVVAYPLKGYQATFFVSRSGLTKYDDVNMTEVNATYSRHEDLGKGWYFANFTSGYASTPNTQPYSMYGALGYRRQFIRGYEIYVIEGSSFILNKSTFKKKIFSHAWNLDDMPLEQFRYFPVAIYLKTYFDWGYVQNYPYYEQNNLNTRLSDRWLAGGGIGLDLVTLYDNVFRFEYTFTREGTHGFFFNIKKEF